MFIRIVKLSFQPNLVADFLDIFENSKDKIRNTKGCRLLELHRDKSQTNLFFTYSHWETERDLENYRNSLFFENVWSQTKKLFDKKPEVWSVDKINSL